MGGKKETTKYESANTFGYQAPPSTPEFQAFHDFQPDTHLLDPALEAQYGASRRAINNGYNEGSGSGITSSVLRNRLRDMGLSELSSQQGEAQRGGAADANQRQMQKLALEYSMRAPQLVQTGGSGTQTTQQSGGLFGQLLQGGFQVAAAF